MFRRSLSVTCVILAAALALKAETVTLTPGENGMQVDIDGQPFTTYNVKDVPRPFFYPIIGGAGANIVRNFPMKEGVAGEPADHKHHRGLWFAHGLVNGMDFWAEEKDFGTQQHTGFANVKAEGNKGSFSSETKWTSPKGDVVMTDSRQFTITALPNGEKYIDFDIVLKATEGDVVLGDTKEGSMAIRLCPQMTFDKKGGQDGHAFSSTGEKQKAVWGKPADWVNFWGTDPNGARVSVTMYSHPTNYRKPMTWHARDYGLFAANPFGMHDFEEKKDQPNLGDYKLAKGESLPLRFRFYFAAGKPKPEDIAAKFQSYVAE